MPVFEVTVHPNGLHPIEAVKAWRKHVEQGMSLDTIIAEGEIAALHGDVPGRKALWAASRRVGLVSHLGCGPTQGGKARGKARGKRNRNSFRA